jgi:voltage-gated potassium channel
MPTPRLLPSALWPTEPRVTRVGVALAALGLLTLAGAAGFMWIADLGPLDALYMTLTTLSTVGYQDLTPGSAATRLYITALIVVGVGTTLYTLATVAEFLIEGRLQDIWGRRAMDRAIQSLRDHVIVCGFGRLGRTVVEALRREDLPVLVVERDAALEPGLAASGACYVVGSALEDAVLRQAGIERARAIVVATSSDADNVFIALSARELNPAITVHARAESEAGMRRLRLARADQVISLHTIGGQRIANAIVRPAVVDFIELTSPFTAEPIDLEQLELASGCPLADRRLRDLPECGVRVSVVAVQRPGERLRLSPGPDDVLVAGDRIVVVGDQDNLRRLAQLAEPPTS